MSVTFGISGGTEEIDGKPGFAHEGYLDGRTGLAPREGARDAVKTGEKLWHVTFG